MSRVLAVPSDAALAELRAAIVAGKSGDALAPVTIAPPSAYAGLSLRRALTAGGGLLNVRFTVLARVAELLGAPALAGDGQLPLTSAVRYHALSEALLAAPGPFRRALDHPRALASLASRLAELDHVEEGTVNALSAVGGATAALVALAAEVSRLTAGWYSAEDLARAATAAVETGAPALADLGRLIVYLPGRLTPAYREMIGALARIDRADVIIALHGDDEADRPSVELLAALSSLGAFDMPGATAVPASPSPVERLVVVPDPDIEVRVVAQELTARLGDGMPLHRMAVLYRNAEPYGRLIPEHLRSCGLPVAGPANATLAQSVSGRTLLGLLALPGEDFSRQAVLAVLNGGPMRASADEPHVPVAVWERLSREANVVRGLDRWQQRLGHLAQRLRGEAAEREARQQDGGGRRAAAAEAQHLAAWVADVGRRLAAPRRGDWHSYADWAGDLLEGALDVSRMDEAEVAAHQQVRLVLTRLAALRGTATPERFLTALGLELSVSFGRVGRFGQGVFVGPLSTAAGTQFDLVVIVGMTEGAFPPRRADDPLLSDRSRVGAWDGDLGTRRRRREEERRAYFSALAAAPIRMLAAPRADLRSQQPRLPARWFVESAASRAGRPVRATELLASRPDWPWLQVVPSLTATLQRAPASLVEARLRRLQRAVALGADPCDERSVQSRPAVRRGMAAVAARATGGLTEWEGLVGRHPLLAIDPARPLSPTALQRWAECPRRYLLDRVLHVRETAKPEEVLQLNALDQGSLVHAALDQFFRERAEADELGRQWTDADRARLLDIVEDHCAEVEAQGLTGKPVLWGIQRRNLHQHLQVFLEQDAAHRSEGGGLVPQAFEAGFGDADDELGPVALTVGERTIRFHGRIDRIDANADGTAVEVIDYKTGRADQVRAIDADPVDAGKRLQLPVYALAASRAYPKAEITASYWFVTDTGSRHVHTRVPLTAETRARFAEVVGHLADGIEDGVFPGNPGPEDRESWEHCRFCPYDRVCPSQRDEIWERVLLSEHAGSYRDLALAVPASPGESGT